MCDCNKSDELEIQTNEKDRQKTWRRKKGERESENKIRVLREIFSQFRQG